MDPRQEIWIDQKFGDELIRKVQSKDWNKDQAIDVLVSKVMERKYITEDVGMASGHRAILLAVSEV